MSVWPSRPSWKQFSEMRRSQPIAPFISVNFATPQTHTDQLVGRICAAAARRGMSAASEEKMARELRVATQRLRMRTAATMSGDGRHRAAAWVLGAEYRVGIFMQAAPWSAMGRAAVRVKQFLGPKLVG
ncbi:MAG: hypothetical protein AB7O04_08960 [Hyphomonadaceae bacterium]